ncbi:MAG: hypothetical protein M3131_08110, partial [Actinomycetota bacterium]|nr:hypothetical protein [Actinomycetota bacterium]
MRDLLLDVIDAAGRRAPYADARHVMLMQETVSVRNGELARLDAGHEEGIGVRVHIDGRWGFAATHGSNRAAAEGALSRALEVAHAQPRASEQPLAEAPPAVGSYSSPTEIDPFDVPLEDKLGLLSSAEAALRDQPGVTVGRAHVYARREEKLFVSTEG